MIFIMSYIRGTMTPLKAIRKNCIECSGTSQKVAVCENVECYFYIYRFGTNPKRKGIGGNPKLRGNSEKH